ncbi:MAG: DUF11 domain-containing protein [bacterium]|nr:DUF11 domain-containing protein [bacterium]
MLFYDYNVQNNDNNGPVNVAVRGNGSGWDNVATYTPFDGSGSESFDITAYIGVDTQVRVEVTGKYSMYLFVDNVQIQYGLDASDPADCNFVVDQDSWLNEGSPGENKGTEAELSASDNPGGSGRPVYRYDLSSIVPSATVTAATAWFYLNGEDSSGAPVDLRRITDSWTELGATWANTAADFDASTVHGSIDPTNLGWVGVDLTSLVQDWVDGTHTNDGLMLLSTGATQTKYTSKEWGTASEQPCMEVVYSAASADLAVTKTVDDATPTEGDTIEYTVVLDNNGPGATTNVAVTDLLPGGVTYVSDTTTQGTYVDGTGVWTVGSMANGASETLTISATVDAGTATTTIVNTASVSASDVADPVAGNDSDTADITVQTADLTLSKTDGPDPAPTGGPLVYTLLVTNNGPDPATTATLTDNLPAGVTLQSATPSQGSCSGTTTVTCNLGTILSSGTASVEIVVVTSGAGTITNNASVTAHEIDLVPGNNAASEDTDVTADSAIVDVPLTQYRRIHGFVDYTVTGASLRTQPNGGGGAACQIGPSASATLSGIPATATVSEAFLYWGGSGATVDADVTFDGGAVTADRTFQGRFSLGANDYEFFSGFEDVTAQVVAKRNGSYSFADLTVDTGDPYCRARAVMAGWSLIVVYADNALSGKTLVLYDGFDVERNGSASYLLTGIFSADPPEAKTTALVWEGDEDLSGANEFLQVNGTSLTDGLNPVDNVYNSTINSLGSTTSYGMDLDTFDVSGLVSAGDTLATTQVSVGPDLVVLNAVVLQVKSNLIAGRVFEDVNYGGGAGRDRATAAAAAPSFAVDRPGVTVELYGAAGNFLRTTTTDASGEYGFTGLIDGTYQVRVVNDTVGSSRPGATGAELAVQTFRTDASTGTAVAVPGEVGGAVPTGQDSPANVALAPLGTLTAQSVAPALITTGIAVTDLDFGYNFDTIVNTNGSGQGSLRQFILNSNLLTNANLDQAGLTTGAETSVFMIPSNADPWSRAKDPNFDAGRGVATIDVGASRLDPITDDDTSLDGTTQTASVGDSNPGTAGNPELAGVAVGTGPDGIEGTGDEPTLPSYPLPEIEIDGNDRGIIVEVAASNTTVTGLALFNAPSANTGILISAGTGSSVTGNLVGVDADGADPGAGSRIAHGVEVFGGAADVTGNFVAFTEDTGIIVDNDSLISGNDVYRPALGNPDGDAISVEGTSGQTITVRENRTDRIAAYGFESWNAAGPFTVEDNTFSRSGESGGVENGGIRLFGTGSTLRHNVVTASAGAGVVLAQRNAPGSNLQNRISQNAIYTNGGLGIDLDSTNIGLVNPNGDGVTANDGAVDANLPNRVLDYPIVTAARLSGTTLSVDGYVGTAALKIAGTHTLEFFKAADDGNNDGEVVAGDAQSVPHGEGRWYIDSCTTAADGSFDCDLTVPAAVALADGDPITATTTDASTNTSEFSANATAFPGLAIVKRAFQSDGTPIASGSTLPAGMPVKFLIYVDNPSGAVTDVSLQEVLDPIFTYQGGSMESDNTLASSVVCPGGVCDEAAIFAQVDGSGVALGDGDADADTGSYSAGTRTIDLGDGNNSNNAQLDLAGDRVLALVFTIRMQ